MNGRRLRASSKISTVMPMPEAFENKAFIARDKYIIVRKRTGIVRCRTA